MEGFGRLLKFDLKVYVYPTVDPKTGELVTASDLRVEDPGVQKLYDYILERGAIVPVEHFDRELLRHGDVSKLVAESIRSGTGEWEALVPHHVRDQVRFFFFFLFFSFFQTRKTQPFFSHNTKHQLHFSFYS